MRIIETVAHYSELCDMHHCKIMVHPCR